MRVTEHESRAVAEGARALVRGSRIGIESPSVQLRVFAVECPECGGSGAIGHDYRPLPMRPDSLDCPRCLVDPLTGKGGIVPVFRARVTGVVPVGPGGLFPYVLPGDGSWWIRWDDRHRESLQVAWDVTDARLWATILEDVEMVGS